MLIFYTQAKKGIKMYKKLLLMLCMAAYAYPISVVDFPSIPCMAFSKDAKLSPFYCFPHKHYQIYKSFCYNKMCGSEEPCMEIIVEHIKGYVFKTEPENLPPAHESSLFKKNSSFFLDNWKKYGSLVEQGYEADVEIKYIAEEKFYGCFARSTIKKGDLIGLYAGEIWELQELNHVLEEKYNKTHPSLCADQLQSYRWHLPYEHPNNRAKKYVVDAFACRNCTAFINHSDSPNCSGVYASEGRYWYILYIADKTIEAGEQLFSDYGKEYWENRKDEKKILTDDKSKATPTTSHAFLKSFVK